MLAAAGAAPAWLEILVAVALFVAALGVVLPVVPGLLLATGGVAVWAVVERTAVGWAVLVVSLIVTAIGLAVKYTVPGGRLRNSGVPTSSMLLGALAGVIGFFVIPFVGAAIGFILGIFAAEWWRLRSLGLAWPSTRTALGAMGLMMLVEFVTVAAIAGVWSAAMVVS